MKNPFIVTMLAATLAGVALNSAAAQSASSNSTSVAAPQSVTNPRVLQAFELRVKEAVRDSLVHAASNVSNGDLERYADKGGTFTKALPHDSFGRVDLSAFSALTTALATGKFSDFQKIPMGGTHTLNGPQGGLALYHNAGNGIDHYVCRPGCGCVLDNRRPLHGVLVKARGKIQVGRRYAIRPVVLKLSQPAFRRACVLGQP